MDNTKAQFAQFDRQLTERMGYTFRDNHIFELAMSHRSVTGPHNERLEFLGDSVLSFIIAEALYRQFPSAKEGQLSRLRATLVKGETLVEMAVDLQLSDCLRLGPGEIKNGGHKRHSILEDAFEALVGAIYLDSDMEKVREIVLAWFDSRLKMISLNDNCRDSKSQLQEFLQGQGYGLPQYEIIDRQGEEHCQTFFVRCSVIELKVEAEASGRSRKQAEQEAAKATLVALGQTDE